MSSYPIPDTILDSITKLAKNFLWHGSGNRSGVPLVSWNIATLGKSKEGIGIKNLNIARTAMMAKNVMSFLNNKAVAWVELAKLKYGSMVDWSLTAPSNCSWFFRFFYKTAKEIKKNVWIQYVNPQSISILNDLCCFEAPLAFEPTFLNMDLALENS